MTEIRMRPALPEDALLLAETRRIVWEETYRGIYPDEMLDQYDPQARAAQDRIHIENPDHRYYLFMAGDTCAGYFSFGPYNYGTYRDFSLCLNSLYIRSEYKGRGLGRQAFACIRSYCCNHNIAKFFCGCNLHNHPARQFYRHMGGIEGQQSGGHENRSQDIIHFEFHIGE